MRLARIGAGAWTRADPSTDRASARSEHELWSCVSDWIVPFVITVVRISPVKS